MGLQKLASGLLLTAAAAFSPSAGSAEPPPSAALRSSTMTHAARLHLAYVRSSSAQADQVSERGLQALASTLAEKTAVEPHGVAAVNIDSDDIGVFPVLYWPVTESAVALSAKTQQKVQAYLDKGGFIIFDIRNSSEPLGSTKSLQRLLGNVTLKIPAAIDKDHVLYKSFYKLETLRGSFNYGTLLVERARSRGADNVSGVIIGENNWAGAWAGLTVPQGSREREMALRSGVNMVMYALTGNYKADQANIMKTIDKLDR